MVWLWILLAALCLVILLLLGAAAFFFKFSICRHSTERPDEQYQDQDSVWHPFGDRMARAQEFIRSHKMCIRDSLATCSCSHFMTDALFRQMLQSAASDAQVELRLVEARAQGPDHPVLWNVPETDYLKFYIFQVV